MSAVLKVARAGLFDTLQDMGRIGFMALGMPTAGAMDRVALRLANALCGNPAGTAGLEIGVMGPDLAGRGRQRARGPSRPALARPDRGARCPAQAAGLRPHASLEARPGAARRHDRGVEHGLSRRRRRLCAAALHGQPVDLCARRQSAASRAASSPRAMRCRWRANRRRLAKRRSSASPSTMAAGRSASSGGRRTTISATRGRRTFTAVGLPRLQGGRSHGHPLRGADRSSTP